MACLPPSLFQRQNRAAEPAPEAPQRNALREPSKPEIMRAEGDKRGAENDARDEKAARLTYGEGLNRAEVAERCGMTKGWVTKALKRWKRKGGDPATFQRKAESAGAELELGVPVRSSWTGGRGGIGGGERRSERIPSLNVSWDTLY